MAEQVIFDHYEVMQRDDGSLFELGRGAMGITYKALDTNLRIPVALKVINAGSIHSELARQRFVREARAAALLRHRHVASVFHLGIEGETYFYAMEFIDGETVESLIRRQGPLDPVLALRITTQVARALNAAQQHELVHRDIKPSNLMLVHEDDELAVKVIDFGLAKSSRSDGGPDGPEMTSAGGFVGTPHFASPEQLEEKEIDVRSDIYSLGVTLWYMLAGRAPFAGTLAQVMSQHLREPPPLGELQDIPAPVQALLSRMLAKDRADRPQTPLELRRELEECINVTTGEGETAAAAPVLVSDAGQTKYPTQFRTRAVVADRYELLDDLGEGQAGKIFRARRKDDRLEVRLIILNPELLSAPDAFTQLERELEKVIAIEHGNLLRVYSFERVEESSFLIVEATRGFSLMEVLRSRRELEAEEALLLLKQAAVGVDHAVQAGLKRVDLALHQMVLHFETAEPQRSLLTSLLTVWPGFVLKLNPLAITRELSMSETWAGEQTIVGDLPASSRDVTPMNLAVRYVQALAAVTYELLGGTVSPVLLGGAAGQTAPRYVPLARLSEAGNEVLKRALDPKRSFASAQEFFHALRGAVTSETVSARTSVPSRAPHLTQLPQPVALPQLTPAAPAGLPMAVKVGSGAVVLVLLGLTLFYFMRPEKVAIPPAPVAVHTPAPVTTPVASPTISAAPEKPPERMPETRQEKLKAQLADAEKYEEAGDWARCLPAYAKIARDFPESDLGRVRLEMIVGELRKKLQKNGANDFPAWRAAIKEAASVDVISAMMLLAEQLRRREPKEAFDWFCAAAAKGHAPAFTQVGLMYSNGAGVPVDLARALWWFEEASDRGDAGGKTCLGECALYGRGMRKDEKHAVELLREASNLNEPRAMNLLGTCYHQGLGTPQNFQEAFRLFNQAQELGFLEALGNLGVLYINGDGVTANPSKGVEFIQKGARAGNATCMYLLARCLEAGSGIGANPVAAESWYKKSAELGNPRAIEWCRKNRVEFVAPRSP